VVEHAIQLISCGLAGGEAVDRAVAGTGKDRSTAG